MTTNLRPAPTRRHLLAGRVAATALPRPAIGEAGPRWGMAIDLARCTGCEACAVTCAQESGTDPATPRMLVAIHEIEIDGRPRIALLARLCQHCAEAPCIAACPVGASRRRRDGIVHVEQAACIGCGDCVRACPYDARALDPRSGVADACDFCAHRVDAGLLPACVEICQGGALVFGDLNNPASAANLLLAAGTAQVLRAEARTAPSVFYVGLGTEG